MTAIVSAATSQPPPAPSLGDALLAAAGRGVVKAVDVTARDVIDDVAKATKRERSSALAGATTATTSPKGATKKATTRSAASSKAATSKTTTSKSTKGYSTKASGEFAFLSDPRMSIEEKLFRFLQLMSKKSNDELVAKMKEFSSGKKTSSSGGSSTDGAKGSSGSGKHTSVWDAMKKVSPGLGTLEKVMGNKAVLGIAKQITGPILAAACSAYGMPQLAPLAMKLGPTLAEAGPKLVKVLDRIPAPGGSSSASAPKPGAAGDGATATSGPAEASGASSSGSGIGVKSDGKTTLSKEESMELEFMMQKQQQLFTTISNILKSMHDMKMVAVNNIR